MAENRYALLVATTEYHDEAFRKLGAPGNDAVELADVLSNATIGGFKVTRVQNKNAHLVQQEIEGLLATRVPDDTVLLYFSGHGVKDDDGNLFLATQNTSRLLLRSSAVPDGFLRDVMKACRAQRQMLILDCCFAGAMAKGLLGKAGGNTVEVNERFQGQGRVILTASTAMQFAFEEDGPTDKARLSVFTRTIVDGLRTGEADLDGDGQVSVQDLYNYAFKRVAVPGSHQTPTISSIGQEGSIFVARVPESAAGRRQSQILRLPPTGISRPRDMRPWVHIHDQGAEGANPAVAAVTALETWLALRGSDVRLSARYVYQKAKQLHRVEQSADTGIGMDVLARVLQKFGVPPEKDWPYLPGRWQLPRGRTWKDLDKRAAPYRARLISVTSADEIPFHLGKLRPVLAAFDVYGSTWLGADTSRHGKIDPPREGAKEEPVGTVATTIVDYDADARTIRFAHTWGANWGDRGFGEMSFDAAQAMFKQEEMWAVEVKSSSGFGWTSAAPAPPPAKPLSRARPSVDVRTGASARAQTPARHAKRAEVRSGPVPGAPRRAVYDAKHQSVDWSVATLPTRALARGEGDPRAGDRVVDQTYDALGIFGRFIWEAFGRDSWDGKAGPLEAVVHYGRDFDSAFWDGHRVFLGDGGAFFRKFHTVDVVAKEVAMGVAQSETKLAYQGQPGALLQSFGFAFASMTKQYHLNQTAARADWLIGEGCLVNGKAIASLVRPGTAFKNSEFGADPMVGHMSEYVKTDDDDGGVHINCGIPNRAFALAAKALGGHSWERAGRVWYDALCSGRLVPTTTFRQFAQQTMAAARSRFRRDPDVARAVRDAWATVGIALAARRA